MENKGFEREVIERLKAIEVKIDDYNSTKDKAEEGYNKSINNEKDIKEIKDKMKFLGNTITTGVIGIVIAAIVFVIKMMK